MKITWRITRTAYLLGAAGLALLLGCAEQQATAPLKARPSLDISKSPEFTATIASDITLYDKDGKARHYKHSQKVKANFQGGVAHASVTISGQAKAMMVVPVDGVLPPTDPPPPEVVLTPVLAVAYGAYPGDYDETTIDDFGNQVHLVGTGPAYSNSPVTDSWAYVNGSLVAYEHSDWTEVYGGFALTTQALHSYSAGSPTGLVYSRVDAATIPMLMSNQSFGSKFGALTRKTLTRVACALTPQAAYAASMSMCYLEGFWFAGETVALGAATYSGAAFIYPGAYLWGWAEWTRGLYGFLNCLNRRPRCYYCRGGGGGSGW